MQFTFKALGADGKITSSEIEALNRSEAISAITKKGFKLISISEKISSPQRKQQSFKTSKSSKSLKLSQETLLIFFEKLQRMLSAGLSISEAVGITNKRSINPAEKIFTTNILKNLEGGLLFSESLKKSGVKLNDTILNMLLVGESSGNLAIILPDIVESLRSQTEMKKKLITSLTYPAFMFCFALLMMLVFAFIVAPKLQNLITELGGEIPALMTYLIKFSNIFVFAMPFIVVAAFALPGLIWRIRKTDSGRFMTDKLILKIWPFSILLPLFTKTNLSNMMATLLSNNVTTSDALNLAQGAISNKFFLERFIHAKNAILEGRSMCTSLENFGVFEGIACDFIEIGEKTAKLADAFKYANQYYSDHLKSSLRGITIAVTSATMTFVFSFAGILILTMVKGIMGATSAS